MLILTGNNEAAAAIINTEAYHPVLLVCLKIIPAMPHKPHSQDSQCVRVVAGFIASRLKLCVMVKAHTVNHPVKTTITANKQLAFIPATEAPEGCLCDFLLC